jgi:hypothetical protein
MQVSGDSAWVVFLAAFGGAIAGGLTSTIGSAILSRRSVIQFARTRIYTEDVPNLRVSVDSYADDVNLTQRPLSLNSMGRSCVSLTRSERLKILDITRNWDEWVAQPLQRAENRESLDAELTKLDVQLRAKLGYKSVL